MRYGLSVIISENEATVATLREEAGCFVLLTNVPKVQVQEQEQESGYILRGDGDQNRPTAHPQLGT
jgi:hypothetical protein